MISRRGLLAAPFAAVQRPNFLVILTDQQTHNAWSGCGNAWLKTPAMDSIARRGMVYTNAVCPYPVCSPSRAGLLTGRYGVRTGVHTVLMPTDTGGLSENEVTIAQMLKRLNYRTMCIGKWHLGRPEKYLPMARGFDGSRRR